MGLKLRNLQDMEGKARGTKADSRGCPGTLGSVAAGPPWFGWFLGVQLPESLVGDRANAFDRHGQSFGTKITRSSGHGKEGQGNQSRQSELPWDSWFARHGSLWVQVVRSLACRGVPLGGQTREPPLPTSSPRAAKQGWEPPDRSRGYRGSAAVSVAEIVCPKKGTPFWDTQSPLQASLANSNSNYPCSSN